SVWLRMLGAPSVLYCWAVWIILGQASGSYVGPKTWAVLLIGAASSILTVGSHQPRLAASPDLRLRLQPPYLPPSGYLPPWPILAMPDGAPCSRRAPRPSPLCRR